MLDLSPHANTNIATDASEQAPLATNDDDDDAVAAATSLSHQNDPLEVYKALENELEQYDATLLTCDENRNTFLMAIFFTFFYNHSRPRVIVGNKMDMAGSAERWQNFERRFRAYEQQKYEREASAATDVGRSRTFQPHRYKHPTLLSISALDNQNIEVLKKVLSQIKLKSL